MKKNEFIINQFISLRLEDNKTNIYIDNQLFKQCSFLLLNISVEEVDDFKEINSIDDAIEKSLTSLNIMEDIKDVISPKIEFMAHSSNLQAWYENFYDTRLLHRNIAFPLLKKLTEVGDPLAKEVFKEEIIQRYISGNETVKNYLYIEEYLNFLDTEEIVNGLLKPTEANVMEELMVKSNVKYKFVRRFEEDEVKERYFLNPLYFSEKQGYIDELEIDLAQFKNQLPQFLCKFKRLRTLKLFLTSNIKVIFNINLKLSSIHNLEMFIDGNIHISNSFQNVPNLFSLYIYGNGLPKFEKVPSSLKILSNLTILEIHGTSVTSLPVNDLKNLEWVILDNTGIKKITNYGKSLKTLIIDGNKIL